MKTAVVILNWNGRDLLEKFLPSVVKYSAEAAIYVADNASTDDSVEFLEKHFPRVKRIQNKENGGFSKGYNQALAHLREELFILLNSDVEVTENWLHPIIAHFEDHPKTAVVQPKLLDYNHKDTFEYSGAAGGFVDKYAFPFCRGRIFDTIEKDHGQYDRETPIFWASGACFCIRREVFQNINGMDDTYFAHQEEIDLCWRARNAGHRIMYLPQSKVYHLGGGTLNAMQPQKTFLNFRNSLFNILKNVPQYRRILFMRLCLDGLAGLKFILSRKPEHARAIIKAHFSFYAHYSEMKAKRSGKGGNSAYAAITSIVWQYYFKRIRIFSNLKLKWKDNLA